MKKYNFTSYLLVAMTILYSILDSRAFLVDDFFYYYYAVFDFLSVGTLFSIAYIYAILQKIRKYEATFVISRFSKKSNVLFFMLYDLVKTALAMVLMENLITIVAALIISGHKAIQINIFEVSTLMVSQSLGWILIGLIYTLFFIISSKVNISAVFTQIVVACMFFSQSETFSMKRLFFDLYKYMFFYYNEKGYIKKIVVLLIAVCGLYFINHIVYGRKSIYGGTANEESSNA